MWEKIKSILTTTKYQVRIGLAVVLIFLGGYNLFFIGDDEGHGDNISIKIERLVMIILFMKHMKLGLF